MTIIVSVKINDGIVMAADSALTFPGGQIYQHASKIINLRKGLPIGVMSTGYGGIGPESMETLFKDLRKRFAGEDAAYRNWQLDPAAFTIGEVAARVREFLFVEKGRSGTIPIVTSVQVCGYSAGRPSAESWQIHLNATSCDPPSLVQDEAAVGPLWNGEMEALDRLIFGIGSDFVKAALEAGLSDVQSLEAQNKMRSKLYCQLVMNAMPIQDAIDLARFLVETTSGFMKFAIGRAKTVGGAVEIASITKHEGFKWIQRKQFFRSELN